MKRILITAFEVNPYKSSEDSAGWNIPLEIAKSNQVKLDKSNCIFLHYRISQFDHLETNKTKKINFYFYGRIKKEKGHFYPLETLQLVDTKKHEKCKFYIVGGTVMGKESYLNNLVTIALDSGISKYIEFKNFTSDITIELNLTNVCLISSLMRDPFPKTVLETTSV